MKVSGLEYRGQVEGGIISSVFTVQVVLWQLGRREHTPKGLSARDGLMERDCVTQKMF